MNPLMRAMDRIVYVAAGRAAVGSTDEVVRSEVLGRLYGQHVDVLRVHDRILVVAAGDDDHAGTDDSPGPPRQVADSTGAIVGELR
jgi:zinc/manganese transport system ATP-binding protein